MSLIQLCQREVHAYIAYAVKLATGNSVGVFCVFITFFEMAKKRVMLRCALH